MQSLNESWSNLKNSLYSKLTPVEQERLRIAFFTGIEVYRCSVDSAKSEASEVKLQEIENEMTLFIEEMDAASFKMRGSSHAAFEGRIVEGI